MPFPIDSMAASAPSLSRWRRRGKPGGFSQNAYQRWWPRTNEAIGEWRLRSLQRRNAHEQDLNSKGW